VDFTTGILNGAEDNFVHVVGIEHLTALTYEICAYVVE